MGDLTGKRQVRRLQNGRSYNTFPTMFKAKDVPFFCMTKYKTCTPFAVMEDAMVGTIFV